MELLDLYNSKKEKTGNTWVRLKNGEPKEGEYKLNVHVWFINSKNELLIQKRGDNLIRYPGLWGFTGGAVDAGESSYQGAKREVKEELGIDYDNLQFMMSFKREHDFVDVWMGRIDIELDDLKLLDCEVSLAKWVTMEELENMINNDEFVPSIKLYYDLFKKLIYKCYKK